LNGGRNLWTIIITIFIDSGDDMDFPPPNQLQPWISQLPRGVQDFLNSGGWLLLAVFLGLIVLLAAALTVRALFRALFGRRKPAPGESDQEFVEELNQCPMPAGDPGERRLTVYHLPVRIRLVIVASMGRETGLDALAVEALLDQVVPGLGDAARRDRPKIRVWPAQLSHTGFATAFQRRMHKPESDDLASQWVLVTGRTQMGRQPLLVGLALWADEPNMVGRLNLEPHQWLDVLRLRRLEDT
jgi:hypothetical protein